MMRCAAARRSRLSASYLTGFQVVHELTPSVVKSLLFIRHPAKTPLAQREKLVFERPFACCLRWAIATTWVLLPCEIYPQEILPAPGVVEVERVVVTGSNIPTAEEIGPNPVDTYRPTDIEKLGMRNATDLLTNLPQEMGSTINQNASTSRTDDGSVIPNLRGLLPKETLVLIDGKRAAIIGSGGGAAAGASPGLTGVDINLI